MSGAYINSKGEYIWNEMFKWVRWSGGAQDFGHTVYNKWPGITNIKSSICSSLVRDLCKIFLRKRNTISHARAATNKYRYLFCLVLLIITLLFRLFDICDYKRRFQYRRVRCVEKAEVALVWFRASPEWGGYEICQHSINSINRMDHSKAQLYDHREKSRKFCTVLLHAAESDATCCLLLSQTNCYYKIQINITFHPPDAEKLGTQVQE